MIGLSMEQTTGWDYAQRCAEVEAERLQKFAENRPLVRSAIKRICPDTQATEVQLELFDAVPRDSYDYVERLLRQLPRKRQRDHFRKLYLRELRSVKNDGSIAFESGNKSLRHANQFLHELVEKRLNLVLKQYQFEFDWLHYSTAEKWAWATQHYAEYAPIIASQGFHRYASESFWQVKPKTPLPFYLMPETKVKQLAEQLADTFTSLQTQFFTERAERGERYTDAQLTGVLADIYAQCGALCEKLGIVLPYWQSFLQTDHPNMNKMEVALNKIADEGYWFRTLRQIQRQMVEHLAIACGEVRKGVSPYISLHGLGEWRSQMKKNFDFLKQMIVQNVDAPEEQVELLEMYLRSSANPSLRRLEMMTRLRGIEEWSEENDYQALFITLTAPSSFHAQRSSAEQNPKWSGVSPKQTQAYLNKVWQQVRALFKKHSIVFYGMRVAEPHHDATPHWHLLMYVKPEQVDKACEIFKQKALACDGDERGALAHRFRVEKCDKTKGSATAYIAKYIAKNIDGFADEGVMSDEVEGLSFKENAKRVRAWASLWRIRQFQFYGASSISVWRELRRLVQGQCLDEQVETVRIGADLGEYAFYLDKQGGGGALRKHAIVKLSYEDREENKYGEVTKKIVGVINAFKAGADVIKTRLKQWIIKKRPTSSQASQSEAKERERSSPWTCVSNCNPLSDRHLAKSSGQIIDDFLAQNMEQQDRLKQALSWRGLSIDSLEKWHIFSLLQGGSVKLYGNDKLSFNGREVVIGI